MATSATQTTRASRAQPETLRFRTVMPSLNVRNIDISLLWYCSRLGFVVQDEMRSEKRLAAVTLRAGDIIFLLAQDPEPKPRNGKRGEGVGLYCTTAQEIDQVAMNIRARGTVLEYGPVDQPWGAREFAVLDPDGYRIIISNWNLPDLA